MFLSNCEILVLVLLLTFRRVLSLILNESRSHIVLLETLQEDIEDMNGLEKNSMLCYPEMTWLCTSQNTRGISSILAIAFKTKNPLLVWLKNGKSINYGGKSGRMLQLMSQSETRYLFHFHFCVQIKGCVILYEL